SQPFFCLIASQEVSAALLRIDLFQVDHLHEIVAFFSASQNLCAFARGPLQFGVGHMQLAGSGKDQVWFADGVVTSVSANLGILPQQLGNGALFDLILVKIAGAVVDDVEKSITYKANTQRSALQS